MPPSSLIFVLIVAIWAAYLLQHWIRRREHLATARSVDRFSEAMRVLERRRPLPQSSLVAPEPRSYAVSPARPVRAEIVVKRAEPSLPATAPGGMVRVTNPAVRLLSSLTLRRVRRCSLVLAVSAVAALVPLAALGIVAWWPVPVALVVVAADLVWLRQGVLAERRAHRDQAARVVQRVRARRLATAGLLDEEPAGPAGMERTAPARAHLGDLDDLERPATPVAAAAPERAGDGTSAGADVAAAGASLPVAGTWQPVPVPPPTYTLKARAPERPWAEPAAVTPSPAPVARATSTGTVTAAPFDRLAGADTEPVEAADAAAAGAARAMDDDAWASGTVGLPFDGLALDEELEELPAAYAVG